MNIFEIKKQLELEELEQGIKLLLKLPRNKRVHMVFDYCGITMSDVARHAGRSVANVSYLFTDKQKSRPTQEKALELLRRILRERGIDYCPTDHELFRPDCDLAEQCANG